jgi:two-component system KDP operon response regulator KdpE
MERYSKPAVRPAVFRSGELQVDVTTRKVTVRGEQVNLTSTEYSLLLLFVQHAGRVLTHRQILLEIWDLKEAEKTGRLRVYMTYLREKIEANPAKPQLLLTIPGVGYRLEIRD